MIVQALPENALEKLVPKDEEEAPANEGEVQPKQGTSG